MQNQPDKNQRAREIIEEILYITIATADKAGQPWNSPVYSAFDPEFNFYWASDQHGQHSKNIAENDQVFLVIYDSRAPEGTGEGVYIQAEARMLTAETEIQRALGYLYRRKGQDPQKRSTQEFLGDFPRRVYQAVPEQVWLNGDGEINGQYIDVRHMVNLAG